MNTYNLLKVEYLLIFTHIVSKTVDLVSPTDSHIQIKHHVKHRNPLWRVCQTRTTWFKLGGACHVLTLTSCTRTHIYKQLLFNLFYLPPYRSSVEDQHILQLIVEWVVFHKCLKVSHSLQGSEVCCCKDTGLGAWL